jgi:hypothetical protein
MQMPHVQTVTISHYLLKYGRSERVSEKGREEGEVSNTLKNTE